MHMIKTRIILIRHCETAGNVNMIFQGRSDTEVTENGKRQLELLSLRLRNVPMDSIYASPLKRTVVTAQAVNQYHHLPIRLCENVIEIDGGVWEGNRISDFALLYPQDEEAWDIRPWEFNPEGGESMRQVYDRVWEGITDIIGENKGKNVCVVSHGCAIRNILCHCLGLPLERITEVPWGVNTAVSYIDFYEDGHISIELQNDASHLPSAASGFCGKIEKGQAKS